MYCINFSVGHGVCIRKYLSIKKFKVLGDAFVDSQFDYVSIVWKIFKKKLHLKIRKIHYKSLEAACQSEAFDENSLKLSNTGCIKKNMHAEKIRFIKNWEELFK